MEGGSTIANLVFSKDEGFNGGFKDTRDALPMDPTNGIPGWKTTVLMVQKS